MSPLTHHSWTFATYRQVSPFRGHLLFLMRPVSPSVAQCCGSMGHNKGSRQFRWKMTRTLTLRVLETQSDVSDGVGHHRHMPICPIISVV
jgi:hypothetical protein